MAHGPGNLTQGRDHSVGVLLRGDSPAELGRVVGEKRGGSGGDQLGQDLVRARRGLHVLEEGAARHLLREPSGASGSGELESRKEIVNLVGLP